MLGLDQDLIHPEPLILSECTFLLALFVVVTLFTLVDQVS